jgi:hypothetical protein
VNIIIYFLIPVSLLIDILTSSVFEQGGHISIIRAVIFFFIIFGYLIFMNNKFNKVTWFVLFYCFFIVIQVLASTDLFNSARVSFKILLTLLMFPFGYYAINNWDRLKILNRSILFAGILFIGNFVISQYYGLGVSDYTKSDDFLLGSLSDSWNNIVYILLVTPLIMITEHKKRIFIGLIMISLFLLMIIGLKRVAILVTLSGFVFYAFSIYKVSIKNLIKSIMVFFVIYIVIAVNFDLIENRIDARGDKMQPDVVEVLSNEGRFLETIVVWNEVISMQDPIKVWLGFEAFNSVGNYGEGSFGERQLHIDYNNIVNTTGLVGLLLYFLIFLLIYQQKQQIKNRMGRLSGSQKVLLAVFTVLFFGQFLTSFGGQMYAVTFRSIIFLYLGAILGLLSKYAYRK